MKIMLTDEMDKLTTLFVNADDFKRGLNDIIRQRGNLYHLDVLVKVPVDIVDRVKDYYYPMAISVKVLGINANNVLLHINWA